MKLFLMMILCTFTTRALAGDSFRDQLEGELSADDREEAKSILIEEIQDYVNAQNIIYRSRLEKVSTMSQFEKDKLKDQFGGLAYEETIITLLRGELYNQIRSFYVISKDGAFVNGIKDHGEENTQWLEHWALDFAQHVRMAATFGESSERIAIRAGKILVELLLSSQRDVPVTPKQKRTIALALAAVVWEGQSKLIFRDFFGLQSRPGDAILNLSPMHKARLGPMLSSFVEGIHFASMSKEQLELFLSMPNSRKIFDQESAKASRILPLVERLMGKRYDVDLKAMFWDREDFESNRNVYLDAKAQMRSTDDFGMNELQLINNVSGILSRNQQRFFEIIRSVRGH